MELKLEFRLFSRKDSEVFKFIIAYEIQEKIERVDYETDNLFFYLPCLFDSHIRGVRAKTDSNPYYYDTFTKGENRLLGVSKKNGRTS